MFSSAPPAMRPNLLLFVLYRVTSRLYFHLPVLFLHLFSSDVGFYNIIILLALYGAVTMVTANLSTALLPYLRQKNIIALGELLKAAGLALIILGTRVANTDFWMIVASQIVGGIGFSLAISTDSSLLRTITTGGPDKTFGEVQTRSQSLMFIATLVAGIIGGILYAYEGHWPFYASFFVALTAATWISFVREDAAPRPAASPAGRKQPKPKLTLDQDQLFWMRFYSFSRAFTMAPFIGFLTFYFIMIGVDTYLFGAVLSLFTLCGFVGALYTNAFLQRFGLKALMTLTIGCMLSSMLLFGMSDWLSWLGIDYFPVGLLAIALLGIGSGGVRPAAMGNINMGPLSPAQRTTLLSTMERNFGIYNSILLLAGGFLLVQFSFQTLMLILAATYLLLMGALTASKAAAPKPLEKVATP